MIKKADRKNKLQNMLSAIGGLSYWLSQPSEERFATSIFTFDSKKMAQRNDKYALFLTCQRIAVQTRPLHPEATLDCSSALYKEYSTYNRYNNMMGKYLDMPSKSDAALLRPLLQMLYV